MFNLKKINIEAIPNALAKAERYRLLNEPLEAESICLDILEIDPANLEAMIMLFLALTDQFKFELYPAYTQAQEVLDRMKDRYCTAYYSGILFERRAKFHLERGGPGAGHQAYQWFKKAMDTYANALDTCAPGNQDAVLRWNTCARIIMRNPDLAPAPRESEEQMLE